MNPDDLVPRDWTARTADGAPFSLAMLDEMIESCDPPEWTGFAEGHPLKPEGGIVWRDGPPEGPRPTWDDLVDREGSR